MAIVDECPECGDDTSVPARALLATIDLGQPREQPLGRLTWVCFSCDDLVIADIELADLLQLLSVGVLVVDDDFGVGPGVGPSTDGESTPFHGEQLGRSPPFTSEDVCAIRELPDDDAWFQRFGHPGGG